MNKFPKHSNLQSQRGHSAMHYDLCLTLWSSELSPDSIKEMSSCPEGISFLQVIGNIGLNVGFHFSISQCGI
jgi:hypothetical protein